MATGMEGELYRMEKSFKRERVITTVKEVNELISLISKYGLNVVKIGRDCEIKTLNAYLAIKKDLKLNSNIIIELKQTKLCITTMYYKEFKPCTYTFNLNEEEMFVNSGHKCFAEFSKYFKMPRANTYQNKLLNMWFNEEKGNYACSASPAINYNRKYENQELHDVWEYDLNSAYSSVLLDEVPDLYHPLWKQDQYVKKGYIGFYIDDDLTMVEAGGHADVTFPLIKTPEKLKEFCIKWYNKKNESTGNAKLEAKAMLNLPIGYCQRYNPFFRSYVVHKCNLEIVNLLDQDSIFWNTDALFSLKRRPDLEIGTDIGQFKEKHFKTVRYIGNSYQTDDELPVYRGVPKAWFRRFEKENGRKFNILIDEIPQDKNMYSWNWDKLRLEKNYE